MAYVFMLAAVHVVVKNRAVGHQLAALFPSSHLHQAAAVPVAAVLLPPVLLHLAAASAALLLQWKTLVLWATLPLL